MVIMVYELQATIDSESREILDTLMNKNVTTLIDRYSYENNVSQ